MGRLNEVKSWMHWYGWTQHGGPGAVKLDRDGMPIARHGDATWQADVDEALATEERLAQKEHSR